MTKQDLKIQHKLYIIRLTQKGVSVISYNCPICKTEIETRKNETGENWDSICTCYECESLYRKITKANGGKVEASLL